MDGWVFGLVWLFDIRLVRSFNTATSGFRDTVIQTDR